MCRSLEVASNEHGQTKLVISQAECENCEAVEPLSLDFILDPAEAVDVAMGLFNTAAPHVMKEAARDAG